MEGDIYAKNKKMFIDLNDDCIDLWVILFLFIRKAGRKRLFSYYS